jgi:citrate lyase beta subunit
VKLHRSAADPVTSRVDHVMADLEEACPYASKGEKSRAVTVEALRTLDFGPKVVTVRPNDVRSKFFRGDLEAVVRGAPNRFHGLVLPKLQGPEDVVEVARLLDALEPQAGWTYRLQLEAQIETPRALVHAYAIATASDRVCGLVFGIADFAAALGVREIVEDQNRSFHYAKQAVVVAAKAAGLHAIDNAYLRLARAGDPPERVAAVERGLREKNLGAAALGMDGTWVIHPQQVRIANECFSPSPEQVRYAKRVIELWRRAGGGALADPETGETIDETTIRIALKDAAKGVQAGMLEAEWLAAQTAGTDAGVCGDILEVLRRVA